MKKLLFIASLLMMLTSCFEPKEKPFTISGKSKSIDSKFGECYFVYYDRNGRRGAFYEDCDKYEIGDVIK